MASTNGRISGKFQGGGVHFQSNNLYCRFWTMTRGFQQGLFRKKMQYNFPKKRGWGQGILGKLDSGKSDPGKLGPLPIGHTWTKCWILRKLQCSFKFLHTDLTNYDIFLCMTVGRSIVGYTLHAYCRHYTSHTGGTDLFLSVWFIYWYWIYSANK